MVVSGILHSLVQGPVLFSIFINDMSEGCILSKFTNHTYCETLLLPGGMRGLEESCRYCGETSTVLNLENVGFFVK